MKETDNSSLNPMVRVIKWRITHHFMFWDLHDDAEIPAEFDTAISTGLGLPAWVNHVAFDAPDIVGGFAQSGYHTLCIGGVGFFNKLTPLSCVLPNLFAESHWNEEMGVNGAHSTQNQVALAVDVLQNLPRGRRVFLFLNISATHQPNCLWTPGAGRDSAATMADALAYVDSQLPPLFDALQRRAPALCVLCGDHGTAYGEDGYQGHRLAHPVVWTVPYAEFVLPEKRR